MSNSPYGEPGPEEQRTPNWGPGASGQQPNPQQPAPHQQGGHQQGGAPYPQGGVPQDPGARFGSAPYDPFTAGAPLQKPARQSLLEKLTLISMALYLVGTVAYSMVFASDEIAVLFSDLYAEMGVPQEEIDFILEGLGAFAVVAGIFGSVITVGLYLLVYIPLVKGKSWARVLGLVFAFIGAALTLLNVFTMVGLLFSTAAGMVAALAFLAYLGVTIWWIVVAFDQDVKRYLEQQSR